MNSLIVNVLTKRAEDIRRKLPPAFEIAEHSFNGPEVGVAREHILVAMFMAFVGEDNVQPAQRSVSPDVDCWIGGSPLSIKTVSGVGGVRIKWTANAAKAFEFIRGYQPSSDLLVVRIVWGGEGYICYIPLEVQQDVFRQFHEQYLDYRPLTNTRGVNLSQAAYERIRDDHRSLRLRIHWARTGAAESPYQRWIAYWLK